MSGRVLLSYQASLWVVSPFLFRGLASPLFGVDASALRDEAGRPIIPSDQMRGVVRDAFRVFKSAGFNPLGDDFDAVFGIASHQETTAGASNEPNRARIAFTDFAATQLSKSWQGGAILDAEDYKDTLHEYTRIEIDDVLGAVETGKMQVIELVAPLHAAVKFEGTICVYDSADRKTAWKTWLKRALDHLVAIGGAKSAGFGEVVTGGAHVADAEVTPALPCVVVSTTPTLPDRMRLRVTFDRPILIDADLAHDNAFIGKTVLPGAVFKGALAARLAHEGSGGLALTGDMGDAMSGLVVSHAFPEDVSDDGKWLGHIADLPLPRGSIRSASGTRRRGPFIATRWGIPTASYSRTLWPLQCGAPRCSRAIGSRVCLIARASLPG
jgi:CRISPR/Cas system CSM-associated protein Csm3 (group 7 of RAMP superfamily)